MKNLAINQASSIFLDAGTLCFAHQDDAKANDREPKTAPDTDPPPGAAAQWWDSHPADLPQSTVLWIDADAQDHRSAADSTDHGPGGPPPAPRDT